MNTMEDKVRLALRETGEEISQHSVPPLRLRDTVVRNVTGWHLLDVSTERGPAGGPEGGTAMRLDLSTAVRPAGSRPGNRRAG